MHTILAIFPALIVRRRTLTFYIFCCSVFAEKLRGLRHASYKTTARPREQKGL